MPQKYFESIKQKPKIYIIADPDSLGLSLINNLLSNFCEVSVITSRINVWNEKTKILKENKLLKVLPIDYEINNYELSYSIFIDLYLNRTKNEIDKIAKINNQILGKRFIVLPYQINEPEDKQNFTYVKNFLQNKTAESEYFYVGDVLGPNLDDNSYISKIINYLQNGISIRSSSNIYPILARDISKELVKNLFSFGPSTNEVAYIGKPILVDEFNKYIENLNSNIKVNSYVNTYKRIKTGEYVEEVFNTNLNFSLKETLNWIKNNPKPVIKISKPKVKEIKETKKSFLLSKISLNLRRPKKNIIKVPNIYPKKLNNTNVLYLIFSFVFVLILPFILLFFSVSSLALTVGLIEKGNVKYSIFFLNTSRGLSNISENSFKTLSYVPVVGDLYEYFYYLPSIINETNNIANRFLKLYSTLNTLPSRILGNDIYSISTISHDVALELDTAHKEFSFLIGEIDSLDPVKKNLVFSYIPKEKLDSVKDGILFGKEIFGNLNDILGVSQKKTYLILFQNNMELRPTGGFIGSFALISFDSGRLTEVNVQDVYSADGQLKGHVEPPLPIKNYLGEGGWYLRDANWDPDFTESSKKIEWFLDKEINQKVDGVFSVDLELAKEIIKLTGPITLGDYGKTIDYKNLYEVTQSEVEDNFFPGSRKKSNFLTALTTELINRLTTDNKLNSINLLKIILKGLEEKHIQLYFHSNNLSKVINNFDYDGGVNTKNCQGNCFYDFVSYVDANVGVNKANYFIERSSNLDTYFDGTSVSNILRVTIKNNGNPLLGDKVRYKSYIRAIGLPGSKFEDIVIYEYGQGNIIVPEINSLTNYKEAGTVFLVNPGEEKTIEFKWTNRIYNNLDILNTGQFGVFFRKQAGTVDDRLSINLFMPENMNILGSKYFTLTREGSYVYNTLLTRDVFPLINWK